MTREEAIQILADLTDNPFLHTWEEQYKALHMAIEALTEERLYTHEEAWGMCDYISRADAIDCCECHGSQECKDRIKALPSAESEQIVYCMDCAKSAPLDEHGALWYCKAHDRTTLRHSYCNNGERKGGDTE